MAPWEPSRVQSSAGPQQDLRSACSALSQLISLQTGGQRTQVVEAREMVLKEGSRAKHWRRELASAEHPWYPGAVLKSITWFSLMATLWGRAVRPTLGETQVQRGEGTWCNQASRRWSRHLLLAPSDCKAHILGLELYLTAPFLTLPGIHRALFMWPQLCLGLSGTADNCLAIQLLQVEAKLDPVCDQGWATVSTGRFTSGLAGLRMWTSIHDKPHFRVGNSFRDISTSDQSESQYQYIS